MPESPATPRGSLDAASGARHWDVRRFASIDSTNRYVLDEARAGAPDGLVAVADHQTAGRGRLGRTWESAPGAALLVSVLLRPALPPARVGLVTTAAALALADAVAAVARVASAVKWPNDLMVGDRKLAGILAEADVVGDGVRAVVVGAGCNIRADAVPRGLDNEATACELEGAPAVDRDALLDAYVDALDARVRDAVADPDAVVAAARARSATLGRRVRVDLGADRVVEGDAIDITPVGALIVREQSGMETTIAVGDVVHLRPAPPAGADARRRLNT